MALRNILLDGDITLLKKSRKITEFDNRLHTLIDDLRETLATANGVGLAAVQVGVLRRVVIVIETNVGPDEEEHVVELVNPEIISQEGEQEGAEGCLSLPGKYGFVTRPERVVVRAQDRYGKTFEVEGTGLTARAYCHEIDHMDGLLFSGLCDELYTPEEIEEIMSGEENDDE